MECGHIEKDANLEKMEVVLFVVSKRSCRLKDEQTNDSVQDSGKKKQIWIRFHSYDMATAGGSNKAEQISETGMERCKGDCVLLLQAPRLLKDTRKHQPGSNSGHRRVANPILVLRPLQTLHESESS